MKKLGLLLSALCIGFTSLAQETTGATVTVVIENVLFDGGTILAGLHTSESFMKSDGIANASAPGKIGEAILTFENVAPGTYAIMIMHDANDNKRMDREANGMPTESYGMTGEMNPYGPPVFEDAKFEMGGEDQEFRIRF